MADSNFDVYEIFKKLGFSNEDTDTIMGYIKDLDASPATKLNVGILFINKGWSAKEATLFTDYVESVQGRLLDKNAQKERPITNHQTNTFDEVATKSDIDSIKNDLYRKNQNLTRVIIFSMFWMLLIMLIVIHGYIKH
jgi:hypothetical protein